MCETKYKICIFLFLFLFSRVWWNKKCAKVVNRMYNFLKIIQPVFLFDKKRGLLWEWRVSIPHCHMFICFTTLVSYDRYFEEEKSRGNGPYIIIIVEKRKRIMIDWIYPLGRITNNWQIDWYQLSEIMISIHCMMRVFFYLKNMFKYNKIISIRFQCRHNNTNIIIKYKICILTMIYILVFVIYSRVSNFFDELLLCKTIEVHSIYLSTQYYKWIN